MIETDRLIIRPLNFKELEMLASNPLAFAGELSLSVSKSLTEEETLEAIRNDLLPFLSDGDKNASFYTMWVIIAKQQQAIYGGFCFHGAPDEQGEVEIGFGIDNEFRNKGYMTETLSGILRWAKNEQAIKAVKAITETSNFAAIQVLKKSKFECLNQSDGMLTMIYICN